MQLLQWPTILLLRVARPTDECSNRLLRTDVRTARRSGDGKRTTCRLSLYPVNSNISVITIHKYAVVMRLVASACVSVCLSVCLSCSCSNFESLDLKTSFWPMGTPSKCLGQVRLVSRSSGHRWSSQEQKRDIRKAYFCLTLLWQSVFVCFPFTYTAARLINQALAV